MRTQKSELLKQYIDLLEWKRVAGDNSSTTLRKLREMEEKLAEETV